MLAALAALGCVRPLLRHPRLEPAHATAALWTWQPIAFAPHASFQFHLRLDPPLPCPALVWEWGDGCRSASESDCSPGDVGPAVYELGHTYHAAGDFEVRVHVLWEGREVAMGRAPVIVKPRFGGGE